MWGRVRFGGGCCLTTARRLIRNFWIAPANDQKNGLGPYSHNERITKAHDGGASVLCLSTSIEKRNPARPAVTSLGRDVTFGKSGHHSGPWMEMMASSTINRYSSGNFDLGDVEILY